VQLDSQELAKHYIQSSSQIFLARGHLVPSGDPIYAVQKRATFYFINATPQWQVMNAGNWLVCKTLIRKLIQ